MIRKDECDMLEKSVDWAISSQAAQEWVEGSTTRSSSPERMKGPRVQGLIRCIQMRRLGEIETELMEAYRSGMSVPEMVEKWGFSDTAFRVWFRKRGLKTVNKFHKGFIVTHNGYIKVLRPSHPNVDSKGYVGVHVLVMEEHLGRYLADDEIVHHKDDNKANNAIGNLELMTDFDHRSHHARRGDCGWAKYHRNQGHKIRSI
jgi:HNH endonuclease